MTDDYCDRSWKEPSGAPEGEGSSDGDGAVVAYVVLLVPITLVFFWVPLLYALDVLHWRIVQYALSSRTMGVCAVLLFCLLVVVPEWNRGRRPR